MEQELDQIKLSKIDGTAVKSISIKSNPDTSKGSTISCFNVVFNVNGITFETVLDIPCTYPLSYPIFTFNTNESDESFINLSKKLNEGEGLGERRDILSWQMSILWNFLTNSLINSMSS